MGNLTVPLTYAVWAAAPAVAYQAMVAGIEGRGRAFLPLWAVFAGVSVVVSLSASHPMALIGPLAAVTVLSGILYVIGRRAKK